MLRNEAYLRTSKQRNICSNTAVDEFLRRHHLLIKKHKKQADSGSQAPRDSSTAYKPPITSTSSSPRSNAEGNSSA